MKYNNKMNKDVITFALVIKTDGLEYDDRVRKEILTIKKIYPNIRFTIYAMLPINHVTEGVTSYGIPYKSVFIPARERFSPTKRNILKAYQFYVSLKKELKKFDVIWAADVETAFFPFLMRRKIMLWDLHEIPSIFMGNVLTRMFLMYIFKKCKIVLHANPQRIQYLMQCGLIAKPTKHYALRNYPNFGDIDNNYDEKYYYFINWKDDRKCIYLQGLDGSWRSAYESVKAVLAIPGFVAVVVGVFNQAIKDQLLEEYGNELLERVLFVGKVPQLKIPQYVKECYSTLVFYKNVSPNNYYCEANRFYQSIIMGLPVLVGSNPPMKDIVERYGFGISINDDGHDIEKIVQGLKQLISNYDFYKNNVIQNNSVLLWDNQEHLIKEIVDRLLN